MNLCTSPVYQCLKDYCAFCKLPSQKRQSILSSWIAAEHMTPAGAVRGFCATISRGHASREQIYTIDDQYHIVPLHKHTATWDQILARCNSASNKSAAAAQHHGNSVDSLRSEKRSLRSEKRSGTPTQGIEGAEIRKVVKKRRRKLNWQIE